MINSKRFAKIHTAVPLPRSGVLQSSTKAKARLMRVIGKMSFSQTNIEILAILINYTIK